LDHQTLLAVIAAPSPVIPAKAGIPLSLCSSLVASWAPALAGVTEFRGCEYDEHNVSNTLP
jgi:hypothetical protein